MNYDWMAGLTFFLVMAALTRLGYYLAFKVPALRQMRDLNRVQDDLKRAQDKYPPVVKASTLVGVYTNFFFFIAIAPWFLTLESQSIWRIVRDIFVILMVYDFFYYLVHRFWFHGQGPMRRVHAVHHQARNPTFIDAYYVHPLETFIGVILFLLTIIGLGLWLGPFHVVTLVLAFIIFTQINIINHTLVELPDFPYRPLNWITAKHHVHHENMHKGNYASITLLYDKLFGTLD